MASLQVSGNRSLANPVKVACSSPYTKWLVKLRYCLGHWSGWRYEPPTLGFPTGGQVEPPPSLPPGFQSLEFALEDEWVGKTRDAGSGRHKEPLRKRVFLFVTSQGHGGGTAWRGAGWTGRSRSRG